MAWLSFHFLRGQNNSRSSIFLCSETKRKRLLRRLGLNRVLNSWKSLEICPAISQSWKKCWKWQKSYKMVNKTSWASLKQQQVLYKWFGKIIFNKNCKNYLLLQVAKKIFFGDWAPHLSQGVDDRFTRRALPPPPPPTLALVKVWIRHCTVSGRF